MRNIDARATAQRRDGATKRHGYQRAGSRWRGNRSATRESRRAGNPDASPSDAAKARPRCWGSHRRPRFVPRWSGLPKCPKQHELGRWIGAAHPPFEPRASSPLSRAYLSARSQVMSAAWSTMLSGKKRCKASNRRRAPCLTTTHPTGCAPSPPRIEHMGIDHGRGQVRMTRQLLDPTDVVTVLRQMRGKGVPLMPHAA